MHFFYIIDFLLVCEMAPLPGESQERGMNSTDWDVVQGEHVK